MIASREIQQPQFLAVFALELIALQMESTTNQEISEFIRLSQFVCFQIRCTLAKWKT